MDMGRTAVNVLGNTVAVLLVRRFGRVAAEEPPTWPAPVPVLSTGTGPIMTADSIPD
jgi:hypothetical protein